MMITDPFNAESPIRRAGRPPIKTVVLPAAKAMGGFPDAGVLMSPTTAAGNPPIKTVGTPGPVMTPSAVVSDILAAKGISVN